MRAISDQLFTIKRQTENYYKLTSLSILGILIQVTPDNSNLQGTMKIVRVIGDFGYRGGGGCFHLKLVPRGIQNQFNLVKVRVNRGSSYRELSASWYCCLSSDHNFVIFSTQKSKYSMS